MVSISNHAIVFSGCFLSSTTIMTDKITLIINAKYKNVVV